jgi:hypothetical protein
MKRREITEQTEINGTNGKIRVQILSVCSVYFRMFRNLSSAGLFRAFLFLDAVFFDLVLSGL